MKIKILPITLLLLAPLSVAAQDVIGEESGIGMLFSGIVRDPVSLATGGAAAISDGNGAYASFCNPTANMTGERLQAGVSYMKRLPYEATVSRGINTGVSFRFNKVFGATLGFASDWSPAYDITDAYGNKTGQSFSPRNTVINGGFSVWILEKIDLGANLRYMNQSLNPGFKGNALSSDIFAAYTLKDFRFTAGVSNIKLSGEERLPSSATAGIRYSHLFGLHRIAAYGEFDRYFKTASRGSLGASYTFRDLVTVRTGYCLCGNNAPYSSFFSAGLGLKFRFVCLDAAFLPKDGSFCIGVRVVL